MTFTLDLEKVRDHLDKDLINELTTIKKSLIQSLNKKADFAMLDRLNELVAKKVDNEHMRQS